jgi:hypothetical protein
LLKGFPERAALAAVEGEHARILLHAAERLADDVLRDAGRGGLGRDVADEGVEVAAAAGGKRGAGGEEGGEQDGETEDRHANLWVMLGRMMACSRDGRTSGRAPSPLAGEGWGEG